jgi:hypothetical protein
MWTQSRTMMDDYTVCVCVCVCVCASSQEKVLNINQRLKCPYSSLSEVSKSEKNLLSIEQLETLLVYKYGIWYLERLAYEKVTTMILFQYIHKIFQLPFP